MSGKRYTEEFKIAAVKQVARAENSQTITKAGTDPLRTLRS